MTRPVRSCRTRKATAEAPESDEDTGAPEDLKVQDTRTEDKPRASKKRVRQSTDDDDVEPEKPAEVPRKKSRRVGKLARLQEMPLDILFLILSFLHPHDLLRVSRTTKRLRSLLMARSARATWIEALATIPDLPTRPEDLSECAWTCLLFDPFCHICGAKGVRTVLWALRLRACARCIDAADTDSSPLHRERKHYGQSEFIDKATFRYLIPCVETAERRHSYLYFLQTHVAEIRDVLRKPNNGDADHKAWLDINTQKTQAILKHAKLCASWASAERGQREQDIKASRESRKEAIFIKLRELGYSNEVKFMQANAAPYGGPLHQFEHLKCVNQPKDLTPRIWTNIQSDVLKFMDVLRLKCQVDTQLRTLYNRMKTLVSVLQARTTSYAPRLIDLYSFETIRLILDRPLEDDEDSVTTESFAEALSDYDAVIAHCEHKRRSDLLGALGIRTGMEDHPRLHLAASVFTCQAQDCGTGSGELSLGEALSHRCSDRYWADYTPRLNEYEWAVTDRTEQVKLVSKWVAGSGASNGIMMAHTAKRAAQIVQLAGLDPALATAADMDAADPWFECKPSYCYTCQSRTQGLIGHKAVYGWRSAIQHNDMKRLEVDKEEKARVVAATVVPGLVLGSAAHVWDCRRCTKSHMTAEEIRDHCEQTHTVSTPVYGDDFALRVGFSSPIPNVTIEC